MQFHYQGKTLTLQGLTIAHLIEEGSLQQGNKLENKEVFLLVTERITKDKQQKVKGSSATIQTSLQSYKDVFRKPKGLPPTRARDHTINLLPGTKSISIKPYHYLYYQKEKIVRELMDSRVINPSQSSYSSLVLLVWKVDGLRRLYVDYR